MNEGKSPLGCGKPFTHRAINNFAVNGGVNSLCQIRAHAIQKHLR
ncbi:hypothetical protein FORC066_0198 [Yersinia enterocolitica]|nr:hypothetical protein FORC066_0198 [Yersinia enterocolitica]